jgi:protein-L-isoaspartate(D-aspartate) O-methyltransferase
VVLEEFDFATSRSDMVAYHLQRRGVSDPRVLEVMGRIPRERFVNPVDLDEAYDDRSLGIDCGQTISQPYIVAMMTEMLDLTGSERVLEIGTGSGYQSAVLASLVAEVYSVERHQSLQKVAKTRLADQDFDNVHFLVGDGTLGWSEQAPFDAILVAAAAPYVPEVLRQQLAEGGRLVIPVGSSGSQVLKKIVRQGQSFIEHSGIDCLFVPLIGEEGFDE